MCSLQQVAVVVVSCKVFIHNLFSIAGDIIIVRDGCIKTRIVLIGGMLLHILCTLVAAMGKSSKSKIYVVRHS